MELDAIVQQMYCACAADTDIAKRAGNFSKSVNTMCTAPMACYRSGYLLETKDNSHRRQQTGPSFSKLVFKLTMHVIHYCD